MRLEAPENFVLARGTRKISHARAQQRGMRAREQVPAAGPGIRLQRHERFHNFPTGAPQPLEGLVRRGTLKGSAVRLDRCQQPVGEGTTRAIVRVAPVRGLAQQACGAQMPGNKLSDGLLPPRWSRPASYDGLQRRRRLRAYIESRPLGLRQFSPVDLRRPQSLSQVQELTQRGEYRRLGICGHRVHATFSQLRRGDMRKFLISCYAIGDESGHWALTVCT